MKIKHQEIEILRENPFANCKLAREPYAKVLSGIVNTFTDGFVLAINNEWGTGKTTFVKMWQQKLKNEGFKTIYFNAWKNDFDSNPLVALMSELETLTNAKNKKVFKSVVKKGAVLVKRIAPALAKSLIKNNFVDIGDITLKAIENATNASTEILEEEIKEYVNRKKTILEFQKELEKFVKQAENSKPLIFIVDELDRCRPNYSVEVLEHIKHFFGVYGIVFVLSIDKEQLKNSIKGYYGSDQFDSENYLKRFIDLEYNIPIPESNHYIRYLYDYFDFNSFFYSEARKNIQDFKFDSQNFLNVAELLITNKYIPLRNQEKIFGLLRLIFQTFNSNYYVFPELMFFILFIKESDLSIHNKIIEKRMGPQDMLNLISKFFQRTDNPNLQNLLLNLEINFIFYYANYLEQNGGKKLIQKHKRTNVLTANIKSNINLGNDDEIIRIIEKLSNRMDTNNLGIDYLIKKISLADNIIF